MSRESGAVVVRDRVCKVVHWRETTDHRGISHGGGFAVNLLRALREDVNFVTRFSCGTGSAHLGMSIRTGARSVAAQVVVLPGPRTLPRKAEMWRIPCRGA